MKILISILRTLLLIPICLLVINTLFWGFGEITAWMMGLRGIWIFIVLIMAGSLIYGTYNMVSIYLVLALSYISPHRIITIATVSIITIIQCWNYCYTIWHNYNSLTGWERSLCAIITCMALGLAYSIITGTLIEKQPHDRI
ncbi:MAG: hypothetical protein WCR72_01915 [Bacteroidota bacterium]